MLRERANRANIEIAFIDMRWGVRDENTLDHRTWEECKREILRSFKESYGVFFVSLQGEKYGYCPLPRTIDAELFDQCLRDGCANKEAAALAQKWYELDRNAVCAAQS